ncbi:beta strand repeat-containing protein [Kordia sp.]|uniref:beta strand repeat-containing protein n=1 Tax=Kordia sp. TaxID=1965332 RepID=UPI003D6B5CC2
MKKNILFAIALFYCAISFSQNFNYQAVVRDAAGEPVTNQSMSVLVRIIAGAPNGSILYNEAHTVTSNAQGVITLPVGGGTSGANFLAIDWSTQNHWIDIQVDLAGGTNYTQIGTSELRFVPYAMYALNSTNSTNAGPFNYASGVVSNANGNVITDDFVFGSTQLDANGGIGSDFNRRMFFDKSKAAFRAGKTDGDKWDEANVGLYSAAFGENALASGTNTFAMGRNANATGNEAFAFGINAGGFADYARGFGPNARANGINSTAIGRQLNANSMAEIQLGQYSNFVSGSTDTWVATDRLFVIGNGQEDINLALNSDALVMLKNGNTTLNGTLTIDGDNQGAGTAFTLPAQDGTLNQIMQTDGAGNVSWVTPAADAIPNGGTNGYVLSTDGSGVLSWVTNDDADNDPTNEIELPAQTGEAGKFLTTDGTAVAWQDVPNELPTGGTNGQVLVTDGSGVYSWGDQTATAAFTTTSNVTSNANGTIATDDFVFGSTQLDNVSGADDNSRMFFDKSLGAFRAGNEVDGFTGFNESSIGPFSVGFGQRNVASGWYASTLGGQSNTSSGWYSMTMGDNNTASANYSVALGRSNHSSGLESVALGYNLTAETRGQTTLGQFNTAVAGNANAHVATDRLFVIGNGTSDFDGVTRSDAFVILKNGNTTINGTLTIDGDNQEIERGYTFPAQDGNANQVMTTDGAGNVSWTDAAAGGSGAFSTTANITSNANGDTATDDFVFGSSQLGDVTTATNDDSRMFFDKSKQAFRAGGASNSQWDDANVGGNSIVLGNNSIANNTSSVSIGEGNIASGAAAITAGTNLTAESFGQTSIGTHNTRVTGDATQFVETDRLFVIGNGTNPDEAFRAVGFSDALVMLKNGNTTLNGQLTIDGDNTGSGTSYTLPGQDGTANQVLTTDGSGNVAWAAVASGAMLPSGGTDGQLLKTDGVGNYAWVTDAVDDADSDPTNEIELPTQSGESGKILSTNGTSAVWITDAVNDADSDPMNEIELPTGGTDGQVLKTDGSGNYAWITVAAGAMLPSGGTDGQLLKTDGAGNYAWVTDAVNDADSDPTNEIELPTQSGEAGKILSTNGTSPIWITDAVNDADSDPLNEIELPVGGSNGQVLQTDGSGGYTWTDNTVAPGAYTAATMASGWAYYNTSFSVTNFQDPRYRKVNNVVTLEGLCNKSSAINNADVIMTLPVGFRPTKTRIFSVETENGATRVDVNPNGTVIIATGFNVVQNWVSLDGLTFSID